VTPKDFEEVVIPCVEKHVEKNGHLNYLLVMNPSIHNFSCVSWLSDILKKIRYTCKWNRAAIVTDSKTLKYFTNLVTFFMVGEFMVFPHHQIKEAIHWVSEHE
jgi:hypothetical protein